MYNDRLTHAQKALQAATLDKARLQQALDRVTQFVKDENPEMYETIAERFLSDVEPTTEAWLVSHIESKPLPLELAVMLGE